MWAMEGEWSNAPSKTHHRRQAIRVVQRTHLGYCHRDLGKRHVVLALLARVVQLLLKQLEVAHALGEALLLVPRTLHVRRRVGLNRPHLREIDLREVDPTAAKLILRRRRALRRCHHIALKLLHKIVRILPLEARGAWASSAGGAGYGGRGVGRGELHVVS